ncbi:MAG TPA: hypothetical protein VEW45_05040 [Candidatus Dormibacteraeota bacterium]|nr:hypothetical protein [Candidatus Dormibacteraeota bacterium]
MKRLFGVAVAATLALSACASGPRVEVVCDENGAGQELLGYHCGRVAEAVLTEIGGSAPVEAIVVLGWRGCIPGAFCGLQATTAPPSPVSAVVGVRFADGEPSILRVVGDVSARRLDVAGIIWIEPDRFIDSMIPPPRGAWVTSVRLPSGA